MIETIRNRTGATALLLGIAVATAMAGQQQEFAAAQKANHAALRQYAWKSRTALKRAGEVKQVRLEDVRYDLDGDLQRTVIGGEPAAEDGPSGPGPAGRIKARIAARKREAVKDMLAELAALAESYAHAGPERMRGFLAGAAISKGEGIESGTLRIRGRDVVAIGDEMTAWIDPTSYALRRVSITTTHNAHPLTIVVDYRTLDSGLTYPARSTLAYPAKSLEVVVDTFDYARAGSR